MDSTTILTKTAKGVREVAAKLTRLSRGFLNVLKEVNGKASIDEIRQKLGYPDAEAFLKDIEELVSAGYVRELEVPVKTPPAPPPPPPRPQAAAKPPGAANGSDLDFTAFVPVEEDNSADAARSAEAARQKAIEEAKERSKRELEERIRKEAEMLARREAEKKAKREAQAKAQREAEEKARREAEEKARKEAEAKARREAEERARKEAEEKARREAEERARKEAEEKARKEAEEKARREAEERTLKEAEEKARREAEERERKEAEERARREAEERARKEAEEKARREAEERARKEAEEQARREAEEKARREAEERARKEAEERVRREAEERARKEAEEMARREAEERAREEAEEQARREAEEKARREAEERARKEAEEQARREAEELARKEAEEKARREAEERARKEAEEKARREAEERARMEAEEQARREAEERARKEAEEKARREAEERARKEAEEKARREAEERARRETEEKARLKAEDQARREAEKQAKREAKEQERRRKAEAKEAASAAAGPRVSVSPAALLKWALPLLALALALGVAAVHFVSFDGKIAEFEKAASEHFGQPVKVRAVHLALLPRAYWRLDGVSIGAGDQIKVRQARARAGIGALLGGKPEFDALELDAPIVSDEGLGWLLLGRVKAKQVSFGRIDASDARLDSPHVAPPGFDVQAEIGADGNWQRILLESQDKALRFELAPKGDELQFEFKATGFAMPFGSSLKFANLHAQGSAAAAGLDIARFTGDVGGGSVEGKALIKWSPGWSMEGEVQARQLDGSALAAELLKGERVDGRGSFAMSAAEAAGLFPAARLQGSFALRKGALHGVDLVRLLQGESGAGSTQFSELTGNFIQQRGATQLRDVQLSAGRMTAGGSADIDASGKVDARASVALRLAAEQRRADFAVSGTTDKLVWRRR